MKKGVVISEGTRWRLKNNIKVNKLKAVLRIHDIYQSGLVEVCQHPFATVRKIVKEVIKMKILGKYVSHEYNENQVNHKVHVMYGKYKNFIIKTKYLLKALNQSI